MYHGGKRIQGLQPSMGWMALCESDLLICILASSSETLPPSWQGCFKELTKYTKNTMYYGTSKWQTMVAVISILYVSDAEKLPS